MSSPDDIHWMQQTLGLAQRAAQQGEVPVGAVLVQGGVKIAEGWNRPIGLHDPTAHAEIQCLRAAGQVLANYRLPGTTLYVSLEPCPMCAGAIVHARIQRLVFAASDPRSGAGGSVFDLLRDKVLNHQVDVLGGILENESAEIIHGFFRARR